MTAPRDVPMRHWPDSLVTCVEVIATALTRNGRETAEANRDASDVTMALAEFFGGRMLYFPSAKRLRALARHTEIVEAVNRTGNVRQVAIDFDLSAQQVYYIVNAAKVARREAKQ